MAGARFSNIILKVADLERAAAFWGDAVGLAEVGKGGPFCFFDADGLRIALNEVPGGDPAAAESTTEIVFEVDDPEAVYAEWSDRGVPFEIALRPVTEAGGRSLLAAHFRDPDGHLASLTGWV